MNDIAQVLQANSFQVKQLLRRARIVGEPNMDSIQRGFNKHGETFMLKLLDIITPTEAGFTALIQPKSALLQSGINTTKLMPMAVQTDGRPSPEGRTIWTFWEKLLGGIGATGEAIGKFKTDIAAPVQTAGGPSPDTAKNTKLLYMAASGFVAMIILILILRK